jgi:DNA-binding LytR/AlgR family response regulator
MNVVLCDDNPTFLNDFHHRLQSVAAQCDWVCQYTLYHNPVELLAADLSNTDIIFLDIDMPGINGIQAGRELRERHPDLIIVFVTGFIQYALDGYSVEAFRFLLKDSLQTELIACVRDIQKKLYEKQASVLIRGVEYSRPVQLQDIIYFEGTSQRHSIMHIKHGTMECLGKLSEYEAHLQHRGFLRIQRSYLVNMFHVNCIKNYHVYLSTGGRLKVSERNYQDIIAKYLRWKGKQL